MIATGAFYYHTHVLKERYMNDVLILPLLHFASKGYLGINIG